MKISASKITHYMVASKAKSLWKVSKINQQPLQKGIIQKILPYQPSYILWFLYHGEYNSIRCYSTSFCLYHT